MKTVQSMLGKPGRRAEDHADDAKGLVGRPTCCSSTFASRRGRGLGQGAGRARRAARPGGIPRRSGLAMHDKAIDRARTIVAYCASGGRSALVGKILKDMGYTNVRDLGGFKGWLDAGGEIEKA